MIFDHRTYVCRPGTVPAQMALYEKYGRATQEKHLGKPVLYGIAETGMPRCRWPPSWKFSCAACSESTSPIRHSDFLTLSPDFST